MVAGRARQPLLPDIEAEDPNPDAAALGDDRGVSFEDQQSIPARHAELDDGHLVEAFTNSLARSGVDALS